MDPIVFRQKNMILEGETFTNARLPEIAGEGTAGTASEHGNM